MIITTFLNHFKSSTFQKKISLIIGILGSILGFFFFSKFHQSYFIKEINMTSYFIGFVITFMPASLAFIASIFNNPSLMAIAFLWSFGSLDFIPQRPPDVMFILSRIILVCYIFSFGMMIKNSKERLPPVER